MAVAQPSTDSIMKGTHNLLRNSAVRDFRKAQILNNPGSFTKVRDRPGSQVTKLKETVFDTRVTSSANWQKPKVARLAVSLCFFLNGTVFASWIARIPRVQSSLGMSHATLGLALFGVALGALFAMPLTGRPDG
jgi:hypothetical protein